MKSRKELIEYINNTHYLSNDSITALITNPDLILADEPTGALDSVTGRQVFDTLKKLSETKLYSLISYNRKRLSRATVDILNKKRYHCAEETVTFGSVTMVIASFVTFVHHLFRQLG